MRWRALRLITVPSHRWRIFLLKNGAVYTAPDADSIVIEKGGKLIQLAAFHMEGNVLDKNMLPVEPDTAPNPLPPLPDEKPLPLPPALSKYPATAWVTYKPVPDVPSQKEFSVKCQAGNTIFGKARRKYQYRGSRW